jgi:tripeptide aminopeptidase
MVEQVSAGLFASPLAEEMASDVKQRFLRYVQIDTQSRTGTDEVPSTQKQLDLSRLLMDELRGLGAEDVEIGEAGIVFATIPATIPDEISAIGFLAHVDTSPDESGAGVKPQVVRYEGGPVALPAAPEVAIDPAETPELANHVGHEIVTTDGTTLLGADDKAGVAAIMSAASYLLSHPEVRHGKLRIGFTTDEEIGRGAKFFDIERFGTECAYTIDGSTAGDIEDETFSAAGVDIRFRGFGIHPGYAKDRLVNSIKLAAAFVERLPKDVSPETTEEREGFFHPVQIDGAVDETHIELIVRDFDTAELDRKVDRLRELAEDVVAGEPNATVEFTHARQYLNMRDHLKDVPHVVDAAEEAIKRAGLDARRGYIRGGTDGSMLTAMGLPTPNIFNGAHDFHSVKEWVCVHDMAAAAATIVRLAEVWAEKRPT